MRKLFLAILSLHFIFSFSFAQNQKSLHSYKADYSLLPECSRSEQYKSRLETLFAVNYCYQSVISIPRQEAKGYSCSQILRKLDQMGGLDKECYGVSYIDGSTGKRKPMFKKTLLDEAEHELYIKDKTAGGLTMDFRLDEYADDAAVYAVTALLKKNPDNILLREIKKNEAAIFVLMNEGQSDIKLYVLIQCSYSPLKYKFLRKIVENAVMARVLELQNWFTRMICTER